MEGKDDEYGSLSNYGAILNALSVQEN